MACASLDYESPSTVNLSGKWIIDSTLSQGVIFPSNNASTRGQKKGNKTGGPPPGGGRGGQGKRPDTEENSSDGGGRGPQKPDAAIATEMTIEHSGNSMGVLYQSGNYRDVDWGVTEMRNRTVTAGWQDNSLVIKTKGRRETITETYQLAEKGEVLTVLFDVGGEQYTRVYRLAAQEPVSIISKP